MKFLKLIPLLSILVLLFACKSQDKDAALRQTPIQNKTTDKTQAIAEKDTKNSSEEKEDFDHYFVEGGSKYGAPKAITRNIIEAKNGVIWFATFEGLYKYDGNNFTNVTILDSLRQYRAFSLLEDSSGRIWIGTIGAGVYIYDEKSIAKDQSPWTNYNSNNGLVNNDVGSIFEDSKGNIWIGTRVGVSRYDGKSFKNFTKEDGLADNDINGMIEDKDGKIWFAARGEACYYDGKEFTKITREDGKPFYNARSIILDTKGNIWLGGNDGLWRYDGTSYQDFKTPFIGNIYEDTKGTIWVSQSVGGQTYEMTLNRYDLHNLFSPEPKSTEVINPLGQVFGILEDSENNIWFGHENGVCRYDGLTFEYFKN